MGTVRVIYNKKNKNVSIITPCIQSKKKDETEQQWLDRVFNKYVPQEEDIEYEDMDSSELPSTDRNAWEGEKGVGVYINQTKLATLKKESDEKILIEQEKEILAIDSLKKKGKIE